MRHDSQGNDSFPVESLRGELRFVKYQQLAWWIVFAMQLVVIIRGYWWSRNQPQHLGVWVAVACNSLLIISLVRVLGSYKLVCFLQSSRIPPTEMYAAVVLKCLSFAALRETAARRLAELVPALSRNQAVSIGADWTPLYQYVAGRGPADLRHLAFDVANLIGDESAIPYLRRILGKRDIPPMERARFQDELDALILRTTRRSLL